MKMRRCLGFVVALLVVLPGSAMTLGEFAHKAAGQREGASVESILAALPQGTDVNASLTEGAVVRMMGALGVGLRTAHPDAVFADDAVERLLMSQQTTGRDDDDRRGRRKPRSKSPKRPKPPHPPRRHHHRNR